MITVYVLVCFVVCLSLQWAGLPRCCYSQHPLPGYLWPVGQSGHSHPEEEGFTGGKTKQQSAAYVNNSLNTCYSFFCLERQLGSSPAFLRPWAGWVEMSAWMMREAMGRMRDAQQVVQNFWLQLLYTAGASSWLAGRVWSGLDDWIIWVTLKKLHKWFWECGKLKIK